MSEMVSDWYFLDNALFNGKPKDYLSESDYKKYISTKKIMLTTIYEMYQYIGYKSRLVDIPKNTDEIKMEAFRACASSRKTSAKFISENRSRLLKPLTEGLEQSDRTAVILENRSKRLFLLYTLENVLKNRPLKSCNRPNRIDDMKYCLLDNCIKECKKELISLSSRFCTDIG